MRRLSEAEKLVLMSAHAMLAMAANHTSSGTGSILKMAAQVMLLLADGDNGEAVRRIAKYAEDVTDDGGDDVSDAYIACKPRLLTRGELMALPVDALVEKVIGLRNDIADDAEEIAALTKRAEAAEVRANAMQRTVSVMVTEHAAVLGCDPTMTDVVETMAALVVEHEGMRKVAEAAEARAAQLDAAVSLMTQDTKQDTADLARLHALVKCPADFSDLHDHTACVIAEFERLRASYATLRKAAIGVVTALMFYDPEGDEDDDSEGDLNTATKALEAAIGGSTLP